MRRKSDRTAKKAKASPEKKVEKVKRTKTRRGRKQSSSSENESAEESTGVQEAAIVVEPQQQPVTPTKDGSPEETPDQVWQVKSAQGSSETGEIQKLKICLKRPPSTPERVDRSPRSKRKHTRATSSSDTPSAEGSEEKKERRSKHRSRRSTRDSHDSSEKTQESQSEDAEPVEKETEGSHRAESEITQSTQAAAEVPDDTPMSTTTDETKQDAEAQAESKQDDGESKDEEKPAAADTTVDSSSQPSESEASHQQDQESQGTDDDSPVQVIIIEKSPESQAEESQEEKVVEAVKVQQISTETAPQAKSTPAESSAEPKVSNSEDKNHNQVPEPSQDVDDKATNENDVVDLKNDVELELHAEMPDERPRKHSTDSNKKKGTEESNDRLRSHQSEQSTQEESTVTPNGHATPIVINRKRRWGPRPSKLTTQKSITISTDVLKDIIPDVKPVEFEEVIEEKKQHKRVEAKERVERPVLPKITIDNTDALEQRKERQQEAKEVFKPKELPLSNRKISIVKDGDDIITRPPSPPRHKQSCILYISNLVRPFTLPQLKNLLQRTGRIVEDGFWIDRIKSRCFVIYETEDQAVETRHALHGVTWPVSNPKTLQVDFSTQESFDKAKANEDAENTQTSTIPGTVEDWLREQDAKRERGELEKPWERKNIVREWDVGKGKEDATKGPARDDRPLDKRRHRSSERSPEPARKFKKKEEEAPAKMLDDLFRKTKTTPCIYWLPLSIETIAVKEEQRRQHMMEHERRMHELRRRRH